MKSFTNISSTQNAFLVDYLRGTNRSLTVRQARSLFGIQNLRARISELRNLDLVVRTSKTSNGRSNKYQISSRDLWGSRRSVVSTN